MDWITHRCPTQADADFGGCVTVLCCGIEVPAKWHLVAASTPWKPRAKEPSSASEVPISIAAGNEPFYVVVASDDGGGDPIVWEHPIPRQTTLHAALRLQRSIGARYGRTFIAECRIIPELSRDPQ